MRAKLASCLALCGLVASTTVSAETLRDFLSQGRITGNIRSYYFNQIFSGSDTPNRYAYSLGGMIQAQTPEFLGFRLGIGFYTANSLGVNDISNGQTHLDPLLMGARNSLNVLGQAYVQYKNPQLTVQVGDMLLNTPWMNGADAFMIPNTYQGVSITARPVSWLHLTAIREFRYKNRIQEDYHRQTLLNENPIYEGLLPNNLNGTLTFGLSGQKSGVRAQAWFYRFYGLANLFYNTISYHAPTILRAFRPFASFQYAREWADGRAFLGPINADVYGGMIGVNADLAGVKEQIFAAYDAIPTRSITLDNEKVLYNGGFISPFSQQYNADPLYTTIMDYGLVGSASPGHAWKLGFVIHPWHNLRLKYSYSIYVTAPYHPNVSANYIDVTYTPGEFLEGLSVRDRLAIDHTNPFANYHGTFVDERLMLQYSF